MIMKFKRKVYYATDDSVTGAPQPNIEVPTTPPPAVPATEELPAYFSQFKKENRDKFKDAFKSYKTLDELAEAALKNSQVNTDEYVKIPGKNATEEELKFYIKKIGVPETSEGYELPQEQKSDNTDMQNAIEKAFKDACFRSALSKSQAKNMWGVIKALEETSKDIVQKQNQSAVNGFDGRFEVLFEDKYQDLSKRKEVMNESFSFFHNFLNETGLSKQFEESGLLYDEKVVKTLADYQKRVKGTFISGNGSKGTNKNNSQYAIDYKSDFLDKYGK